MNVAHFSVRHTIARGGLDCWQVVCGAEVIWTTHREDKADILAYRLNAEVNLAEAGTATAPPPHPMLV